MRLSAEDTDIYYKLNLALLTFANKKLNVFPAAKTPEEITQLPFDERVVLRNALWDEDNLIESFLNENPFHFPTDEMNIVGSWNHRIRGRFILISHLKNHSVFFKDDEQIAYGVLGLVDDLETILGPDVPIMVDAVLLPFRKKIIYDGLLSSYRISFGKGFRAGIMDVFQKARSKHGIVTSLPFSAEAKEESDADLLRFYLKNKQNRDQHWEDIEGLIRKKPALRLLYHQEMGKIHARHYRKRFNEVGISGGWFALLEGLVVASGGTKDEAEQAAKRVVPFEKRAWVHYFQAGRK